MRRHKRNEYRSVSETNQLRRSTAPTPETLRDLQVAHLSTVPFENLSIHSGEPIVLNEDALFAKIVEQKRGGFCYECNGLFAGLLRALGFEVAMLGGWGGAARRAGLDRTSIT